MIEETQIGTDITKTNEQIQYDKQAKNLLSYACIEAWILKCLVSEFSDYAVQDICCRTPNYLQLENQINCG